MAIKVPNGVPYISLSTELTAEQFKDWGLDPARGAYCELPPAAKDGDPRELYILSESMIAEIEADWKASAPVLRKHQDAIKSDKSARIEFKDLHPEFATQLTLYDGENIAPHYVQHFPPLSISRAVTAVNQEARRILVENCDRDELANSIEKVLDVSSTSVGAGLDGVLTGAVVKLKAIPGMPDCHWVTATDGSTGRAYWIAVPTSVTTYPEAERFLSPFGKAPVVQS